MIKNLRKTLVIFSLITIFFSFGVSFFISNNCAAAVAVNNEIDNQLTAAAGEKGANLGTATDIRSIVAKIIKYALSLVGTIFLVLTIYAGFTWMTAGGSEEAIEKAKKTLFRAVLGLVIVLAAYAITIFAERLARGAFVDYKNGVYIYGEPYQ